MAVLLRKDCAKPPFFPKVAPLTKHLNFKPHKPFSIVNYVITRSSVSTVNGINAASGASLVKNAKLDLWLKIMPLT